MSRFIPIVALVTFSFVIISCGGGKGGDPIPVTTTGTTGGTTGTTTGGTTGTTTGGTTGGTTTVYTTTTKHINTIGGTVNYDVANNKVTKTLSTNANGGGIQTVDGGAVTVELLNGTNAKVSNLGDALDLTFAATEDPILEYTVTDETAKTKTKTDVHVNKSITGAHLLLQGNTTTAFKNNTITYDAAYVISKMKSSTQVVQVLAYK